ncbi:MAG: transposase [Bacteroidales bacterium]
MSNTKTESARRKRENNIELNNSKTSDEELEYFNAWYKSVNHSSNKNVKIADKTIKSHNENKVSQIGTNISNAKAEQTNSKIAKIQRVANGYHNFDNLRAAILFFNGNLNLLHTIND